MSDGNVASGVTRTPSRPPLWRDIRVLRVFLQVLFTVVVVGIAWYLLNNLRANMAEIGQELNLDWMQGPAGFDIRDSNFSPGRRISAAILVGIGNTAQIAFIGIAAATILGIIVGIGRLSTNWLVRKAAAIYVETLRNIPVLLIIVFFYSAVVLQLPGRDLSRVAGGFIFSNRGVWVPWYSAGGNFGVYLALLGVALVIAIGLWLWRTAVFNRTGSPHHRVLWSFGAILIVAVIGYIALGGPFSVTLPVPANRGAEGGIALGPEYFALLFALVIYTASHIAEIVRGSILAVPHGQTEAANAIALTGFQRLRYVVLPQALRIMVPPLANQYLNLTKNSSLAVAIGYPEVTRIIGTVIGNGNPAPPAIAVLMATYLAFSIGISIIANIVNRLLRLEART
jgi:general L-amino acid transport system permease protein